MSTTTIAAPAGFNSLATTAGEVELSGDLHKGPGAGTVETTWSPEEGVLVYVGDSEGMSVDAARELASDLLSVLGTLSAAS
ncbi:hypothetical protein [Arthrobacter sp. U41]|uniref:hypothetical protein n=1 Tax=Arthrobacter sp. U41 TaxID=1849032 RepID=UPI000859512E|nr:hypothetical protein [Arthrobacter sp. U41]AOT04946.1 hypothetical protein ASPU41_18110 [Arthrobacter sp. U41]